jgi:hypothetical protein
MADRYLVLTSAAYLAASVHDSVDAAALAAGVAVEKDRTQRVIVRVVAEVKPRQAPNVDVVRYDVESEAAHV